MKRLGLLLAQRPDWQIPVRLDRDRVDPAEVEVVKQHHVGVGGQQVGIDETEGSEEEVDLVDGELEDADAEA